MQALSPADAHLGVGLGLRRALADALLAQAPHEVEWLEVAPENYAGTGGLHYRKFRAAAERWPVAAHGLSLSIGGTDPLDRAHLARVRRFVRDHGLRWYTDHLCFTSHGGVQLHDLIPLPFTREAVRHVVERVKIVQGELEVPFGLENVSYYTPLGTPEMDEATFTLEVLEGADCAMLLDVNNVFVNGVNHGFDPKEFLARMPAERVIQLHVAGHRVEAPDLIVDTHGEAIVDPVYELLDWTLARIGPRPILLERDFNIPPLDVLLEEVRRLRAIHAKHLHRAEIAGEARRAVG